MENQMFLIWLIYKNLTNLSCFGILREGIKTMKYSLFADLPYSLSILINLFRNFLQVRNYMSTNHSHFHHKLYNIKVQLHIYMVWLGSVFGNFLIIKEINLQLSAGNQALERLKIQNTVLSFQQVQGKISEKLPQEEQQVHQRHETY